MIASRNVARWTWGRDHQSDPVKLCLCNLLAAYSLLVSERLALGAPKMKIKVIEIGNPDTSLFSGEFAATDSYTEEAIERLASHIRTNMDPGDIASVDASIQCTGIFGTDRDEAIQSGLFTLGTGVYRDYIATDLTTRSDAWLPYDLNGRAQPTVYARNQPRLAAVLTGLADVLDSETTPDEPNVLAIPTETGVENWFEHDATPSDVWTRFESSREQ
ncbi:hypothetical protein ACTWPB_17945 [Nocardia sp. IBHARD005]|uniref:hypothetical protein n=1 Tax=Nocardia sp. IBHARD005 TaxID=3457765 RepID=UPI00405915DE